MYSLRSSRTHCLRASFPVWNVAANARARALANPAQVLALAAQMRLGPCATPCIRSVENARHIGPSFGYSSIRAYAIAY